MLFSFVESELSADMLTVVEVGVAVDSETLKKLPGISLMATLPTGVNMAYYLPKEFAVYFPENLDT